MNVGLTRRGSLERQAFFLGATLDFLERAKFTVSMGVPVIRLRPRTKEAMDMGWPSLATTDPSILEKWNGETPDANCGAVAKAELGGYWFLEIDDASLPTQIETETGQKIPRTYRVRSRVGRGHFYWRQSPTSLALGNVAQGYTKGGNFSARIDGAYVVAANSLHPISGNPYEVVSNAEIIECPDWLLNWIKSQKVDKRKAEEVVRDVKNLIPHGYVHDQLVAQCGRLANSGFPAGEAMEEALLAWAHANCAPPLDDDHIRQVARSTASWKRGDPLAETLFHGGVPAGTTPDVSSASRSAGIIVSPTAAEIEEAAPIVAVPYPVFPDWVMRGTSIYEGLVKPFCDLNSRYEAFMWLPAMTILLNYLGGKVRVENKNLIPSIFMVSIGRRGKVIKSSSVEDAVRFFEYAGMVGQNEQSKNNAEGRALIFTPGSPEGLGMEMQRTGCKNAIAFYDELSTLVNKAGIETSTLTSTLLTIYESGKFQNLTKNLKTSYSHLPGTYCASLIACSTDRNFTSNWAKLAGKSSGLDDRFIFLLAPEVLKPLTPYIHVNTQEAAIETRKLVEKARQKGVYSIVDSSPLRKFTEENNDANRAEIRAEKFALGIAVDMGLDEIEEESIERGLAIVAYEQDVKKYLRTYEANTKEGSVQMEIMYNLRKAMGHMPLRDLQRVMNSTRYGTTLWSQAYLGLSKAGWIRELGTGTKGDPKIVILLRVPEDDD